VERLMADVLAERRRQIAAIEREGEGDDGGTAIRMSRPPDPAVNIPTAPGGRVPVDEPSLQATRPELRAPLAEAMFTDTSLVASEPQSPPRRPGRRGSLVGLASLGLVSLVIVGGVAMRRRDGAAPPVAAASATTTTAAATSDVTASTPPTPGTTTAPATEPPSPPVVSPTDLPEATSPPAARVASPPRRPAPASCNPPYTIGPNGYKKYKRECASL
jgi:hypothetical protein